MFMASPNVHSKDVKWGFILDSQVQSYGYFYERKVDTFAQIF